METEQIRTPYDKAISKTTDDVPYWHCLQYRAQGYRRAVKDYAKLVAAAKKVLNQLIKLNEHQGIDIDYPELEAALAGLEGAEQ